MSEQKPDYGAPYRRASHEREALQAHEEDRGLALGLAMGVAMGFTAGVILTALVGLLLVWG